MLSSDAIRAKRSAQKEAGFDLGALIECHWYHLGSVEEAEEVERFYRIGGTKIQRCQTAEAARAVLDIELGRKGALQSMEHGS